MLVPLLLFEQGVLSRPMFYISSYLEQHRDVYYHRLEFISSEGDWNGWIEFFLAALIEQARHNTEQTRAILELYDRMKRQVPRAIHSQYVVQAIDTLFDRPIFRSTDFVRRSAIPRDSALRILRELRKSGIVTDLRPGRGRTASIMVFRELLEITQE
jgi:Fic family protein